MHDFIQNLSFAAVPVESSSDREIAGPSRLTTTATSEPLRRLTESFNETPTYRPSPRRKLPVRHKSQVTSRKS
jgi:hypothetical protein